MIIRSPEIIALTLSFFATKASRWVFCGWGITVLARRSETLTHARAAGQGSLVTSHFFEDSYFCNLQALRSEAQIGACSRRPRASELSLRVCRSFPQVLFRL